MITFILLVLSSIITGFYITRAFNKELYFSEKLVYGTTISLSLFVQIIYLFTGFYGFKPLNISLVLITIIGITLYSVWKLYEDKQAVKEEILSVKNKLKKLEGIHLPIIFSFWAIIFYVLFTKNLFVNSNGIYSSTSTDMPVHLSFITSFVWGDNFPHQTPLYAGEKLVYPFLSDYFSAFLVACGMNAVLSITFPGMLMCSLLTVIMYWFTFRITSPLKENKDTLELSEQQYSDDTLNKINKPEKYNTNKLAAILSPFLLFLAGGLGFFQFFEKDLPTNHYNLWLTLKNSFDLYTDLDKYNFQFYNFIIGYLLPQRSFIFGFPLAITALALLWIALKRNKKTDFLLSGLTAALIPLFHFHSFMNVVIIASFFAVMFFKKDKEYIKNWLYFFIPMSVIALPQMLFVLTRVSTGKSELFKYYPGWMARDFNYIWFWIKNTGLLFFLVFESLISKDTNKEMKKSYVPFVFLFIIANLISFSPCWIGDNAKVIYFWFIGSIPFVALALVKLFKNQKVIAVTVLMTLILSGSLDITRFLFTPLRTFMIWSKDGMNIAKDIREKTPPHAVFFNAPVHYSPVYLTGRLTLMGEHVHVCTQGIDLYEREREIKAVFESPDIQLKMNLLKKLGADYALIGPPEKRMLTTPDFFKNNFKVIAQEGEETLYKLK